MTDDARWQIDIEFRRALSNAIERAEHRAREFHARWPFVELRTPADFAIDKLLRDRRLTFEELHRPCTI